MQKTNPWVYKNVYVISLETSTRLHTNPRYGNSTPYMAEW